MATAYPIVEGVTFKPVTGFLNYCVGDDGSIWSVHGGSSTRHCIRNNGWVKLRACGRKGCEGLPKNYLQIRLSRNGRAQTRSVSRTVLEAFRGPCPSGMEAAHFPDRDTRNNRLENLHWETKAANESHKSIHGTRRVGSKSNLAKLNEQQIIEIRKRYANGETTGAIGRSLGTDHRNIWLIVTHKTWRHLSG